MNKPVFKIILSVVCVCGMYVCIYACMYLCMYVFMYVCMYVCMYYVCMHVCVYVIPLFHLHNNLSDFLRNLIRALYYWGN